MGQISCPERTSNRLWGGGFLLHGPFVSTLDEVSRVLPSLVMEDRASPRPKVAAHVTGSFAPKLEREGGGESLSRGCGFGSKSTVYMGLMFVNKHRATF